jgi:hypothetical protein
MTTALVIKPPSSGAVKRNQRSFLSVESFEDIQQNGVSPQYRTSKDGEWVPSLLVAW